jgi:hypothetical protein
VLGLGTNFEDALLQFDPIPQRLILENFDVNGEPSASGQPHPLFIYREGTFIQVYPDHMHEGTLFELLVPEDLNNANVWPSGVKPQIIAHGTDSSKKKVVPLIAAYDGDRAGKGRIVADSTWHHYFNVNLTSFVPPGTINSPTDQIGQYYGNLVVWLTPLSKRKEMAQAMVQWAATHPSMLEERFLDEMTDEEETKVVMFLGAKVRDLLSKVASQCEVHELLQTLIPPPARANFETLYFPERTFSLRSFAPGEFLLPSKELLLGTFTNNYHREGARRESSGVGPMLLVAHHEMAAGFTRALDIQKTYVKRLQSASNKWLEL